MGTNQNNSIESIVLDPFTITLIRSKARQLCRRSDFSRSDLDDLQQEMRVHLMEKAHFFDPARGNLEAFVTKVIKSWIAMQLRYRERERRRDAYVAVSLDGVVEIEGLSISLDETLSEEDGQRRMQRYPRSEPEQFELREAVQHVLKNLDPEDRELLHDVVEHGITYACQCRGISWRQADNTLARIRDRVKKAGINGL